MNKIEEDIIIYAFRYALGRRSGAVIEVSDYLINNWSMLAEHTKDQIVHEIEGAMKRNEAGMDCDIKQWQRILSLTQK